MQPYLLLWPLTLRVYEKFPHAFLNGVGRDTMMYYFRSESGVYFDKNFLRRALEYFADVGLLRRLPNGPTGCRAYTLT